MCFDSPNSSKPIGCISHFLRNVADTYWIESMYTEFSALPNIPAGETLRSTFSEQISCKVSYKWTGIGTGKSAFRASEGVCSSTADDFTLSDTGFTSGVSLALTNEDKAAQTAYLTKLSANICKMYARGALSIDDGNSWTTDE